MRSDPKYFEQGTPMGSEVRLLNRLLNHLMRCEVRLRLCLRLLHLLTKPGGFCTRVITNLGRFRARIVLDQTRVERISSARRTMKARPWRLLRVARRIRVVRRTLR